MCLPQFENSVVVNKVVCNVQKSDCLWNLVTVQKCVDYSKEDGPDDVSPRVRS